MRTRALRRGIGREAAKENEGWGRGGTESSSEVVKNQQHVLTLLRKEEGEVVSA